MPAPPEPDVPVSAGVRLARLLAPTRVLVVLITLVTGVVWADSRQARGDDAVPDVLVGVWKSDAGKYAGATLEISKALVGFGSGQAQADVHPIIRVDRTSDGSRQLFTIWYGVEDGTQRHEQHVGFYYDPARKELYLENQRWLAWTNTGPRPTLREMIRALGVAPSDGGSSARAGRPRRAGAP